MEISIFSDQTYIYIRWADILPPTIYDKGAWSFDRQFIRLVTDNTVSQKRAMHDQYFVPLTTEISGVKQLFLFGTNRDYSYFLEHAKSGDDFMFLLCSRARIDLITDTNATKTRLMDEAWRPDFFRN